MKTTIFIKEIHEELNIGKRYFQWFLLSLFLGAETFQRQQTCRALNASNSRLPLFLLLLPPPPPPPPPPPSPLQELQQNC